MKKLLLLLCMCFAVSVFTGCDDDTVTPLTDDEKKEALLSASQAIIDTKVVPNVSATGATTTTAWDGWSAADAYGLTGNTAITPVDAAAVTPIDVTANIDANTTWTEGNIYVLKGRITVLDGFTLTIEPGVIIKGDATLTGENAAVLMIARGGKIEAVGTAAKPIIMTSTLDDILPGQRIGTSLDSDDRGKWGGLVILGKAPISVKGDGTEFQIEGVPATDTNGLYGGSDATDNSGTLKYVSVRHGGVEIGPDQEINGITLGGVGTGTTIEFVEVFANLDDGIEFFGGTVNVTNALVAYQGDDAFDVDQSYAGTVDNFMAFQSTDGDEALEIDGREGSYDDTFTLKNGTIKSTDGKGSAADFKSKAKGAVQNVIWQGYDSSKIKLSLSADEALTEEKEDAALNVANGTLTFTTVNFNVVEVYNK